MVASFKVEKKMHRANTKAHIGGGERGCRWRERERERGSRDGEEKSLAKRPVIWLNCNLLMLHKKRRGRERERESFKSTSLSVVYGWRVKLQSTNGWCMGHNSNFNQSPMAWIHMTDYSLDRSFSPLSLPLARSFTSHVAFNLFLPSNHTIEYQVIHKKKPTLDLYYVTLTTTKCHWHTHAPRERERGAFYSK